MHSADASACLTVDNIWNEVVSIHRSQEVLKMLPSLHVDIFAIVLLKNWYNNPSCTCSTLTPIFAG
jgi:hypothetical protein